MINFLLIQMAWMNVKEKWNREQKWKGEQNEKIHIRGVC